jgi:hypothetical protein
MKVCARDSVVVYGNLASWKIILRQRYLGHALPIRPRARTRQTEWIDPRHPTLDGIRIPATQQFAASSEFTRLKMAHNLRDAGRMTPDRCEIRRSVNNLTVG